MRCTMTSMCPWILASARRTITVLLLRFAFREFLHHGQNQGMSFLTDFLNLRRSDPIGVTLPDPAILCHDLVVMIMDVLLNGLDFFDRQYGHDRHDLFVGAVLLQVRNNILYGDPGCRKLRTAAAIDDLYGLEIGRASCRERE